MKCLYCQSEAKLVKGDITYPHRPDLSELNFWLCSPCDAYVGCHKGTDKTLGRLADKDLRMWKTKAHSSFDPKWKSGKMSRTEAYEWLSKKLKIKVKDCHIGEFDIDQCRKVVEVCK